MLLGACAGTGISPSAGVCTVSQASYSPYGTRLTSEAAPITPSCPAGSPPEAYTPLLPALSEAWSAPVTSTRPVGAAGARAASAAPGSQPRTTGTALPVSVRSRVST